LEKPIVIPNLIRKTAELLLIVNPEAKMNGLDELKAMALADGSGGNTIDQGGWKDEWWNELEAAIFPRWDVSYFPILNCQTTELVPVLSPQILASEAVGTASVCSALDSTSP
jgi:hypothetical protein